MYQGGDGFPVRSGKTIRDRQGRLSHYIYNTASPLGAFVAFGFLGFQFIFSQRAQTEQSDSGDNRFFFIGVKRALFQQTG